MAGNSRRRGAVRKEGTKKGPTVGSGGFLIQSHQYVEEQGQNPNDLALYGQDSNGTVWSICNMNMILHATDDDRLAIEVGQNATEVAVQFVTQRFVAEERPPVFGGQDRVHENFCEGLRHIGMMRETWRGFNPIAHPIAHVDLSRRD